MRDLNQAVGGPLKGDVMELRKYGYQDLRELDAEQQKVLGRKFEFIADVVGDNPDLFVLDNDVVTDNCSLVSKLRDLGAFSKQDHVECKSACLWIYFNRKDDGLNFVHKLTAYLIQKAKLIEKARGY